MEVRIRPLEKEDCHRIAALEEEIFSNPWSEKSLLDMLGKKEVIYLVAETLAEGKFEIAGYIGAWQSYEEADITNVAVSPTYRKHGIGSLLMEQMIAAAWDRGITEMTLEVRVSNVPAIHLYEKYGFLSEGIRPGFYDKPREDAMIMWNRQLRRITIANIGTSLV